VRYLEVGLELCGVRRGIVAAYPYLVKVGRACNSMSVDNAFDTHAQQSVAAWQLAGEDQIGSGDEVRIGVVGQHEWDGQPGEVSTNETWRHETIVRNDNLLEGRTPARQ